MITTIPLLSFLLLAQNRGTSIDLAKQNSTSLPRPSRVDSSPPPGRASDSRLETVVYFRVSFPRDSAGRFTVYSIQNALDSPIQLPVSRDGAAAFKNCHDLPILTSGLIFDSDVVAKPQSIKQAELYGCDGLKGSLVTLKPGERITLTGIVLPTGSDTSGAAITYSLARKTFRREGNDLVLEVRGISSARVALKD